MSLQLDLYISRLADLPPACQEALRSKIVVDYNKIMKSHNLRHLFDNVRGKDVSLLCFVKFVALVLFCC